MTDHNQELVERVARAVRRARFERTGRVGAYDPDLPLHETELADARAGSDGVWQPIETYDGGEPEVDLWVPGRGRVTDAHFHCGEWLAWAASRVDAEPTWERLTPTYWRPLPDPPALSAPEPVEEK